MPHFIYKKSSQWYVKEGNGFPVVLLHGFAEDGDVWKRQTDFLKNNFTVLVPDLPGSGHSPMLQKESDEKDITITDYANCMYALLQHEKIEDCVVIGHSMGGYITLALVEKCKDKIRGFGFVHSTAFADSEEKKAMRIKGICTIEQYGSYAFIKGTTPNLFSSEYRKENANEIEDLIESGHHFAPAVLQQYYNAMRLREDKTAVLKNSASPVFFIAGKEDKAVPLADVLQQVHLPAVSYIHILEGAAHMGMWEKAEKVNEHIFQFVQDIAAPKRLKYT